MKRTRGYAAISLFAISFSAYSAWALDTQAVMDSSTTSATSSDTGTLQDLSIPGHGGGNGGGGGHGGGGGGGGNHPPGPGPGPHPEPHPPGPGPGPHPEPHPPGPGPGPHPEPHPPGPGPGPHPEPHPHPYPPGHGDHHEPYPVHGGGCPWPHWGHPEFPRPDYDWDWYRIRYVTCTASDDLGDIFPVSEDDYAGMEYRERLWQIEDAALDRCYYETGGDESCYLVGCEVIY